MTADKSHQRNIKSYLISFTTPEESDTSFAFLNISWLNPQTLRDT